MPICKLCLLTFEPYVVKTLDNTHFSLLPKAQTSSFLGILPGRQTLSSEASSYIYSICIFLHFIIREHFFCLPAIILSSRISRWTSLIFWIYAFLLFTIILMEVAERREERHVFLIHCLKLEAYFLNKKFTNIT